MEETHSIVETHEAVTTYDNETGEAVTVNEYSLLKPIGEGSFAKVYKAVRAMGGVSKTYAVKVFDKQSLKKKKNWKKVNGKMVMTTALQSVDREIALMKKLSHPNICSLHEVIDDHEGGHLYLVLDFVENGQVMDFTNDIREYRSSSSSLLTPLQAKKYFRDLIKGMDYLHTHQVAHRDLKPENLLVMADDTLKIADFGVAHIFEASVGSGGDDKLSNTEGTFYFMAPECGDGTAFSAYSVDIWAMGVCLYTFLFGKLPFWTDNSTEIFDVIKNTPLSVPPSCTDPDLLSLLHGLLEKDPSKRWSLSQVKECHWITDNNTVALVNDIDVIKREDLTTEEIAGAVTKKRMPLLFVTSKLVHKLHEARHHLADLHHSKEGLTATSSSSDGAMGLAPVPVAQSVLSAVPLPPVISTASPPPAPPAPPVASLSPAPPLPLGHVAGASSPRRATSPASLHDEVGDLPTIKKQKTGPGKSRKSCTLM